MAPTAKPIIFKLDTWKHVDRVLTKIAGSKSIGIGFCLSGLSLQPEGETPWFSPLPNFCFGQLFCRSWWPFMVSTNPVSRILSCSICSFGSVGLELFLSIFQHCSQDGKNNLDEFLYFGQACPWNIICDNFGHKNQHQNLWGGDNTSWTVGVFWVNMYFVSKKKKPTP